MNTRSDRRLAVLPALLALIAATLLGTAVPAQGFEVGFQETYALAKNRAEAVATLIPGTEDWYYYHCRERLDARDFETVGKVLPAWIKRHGRRSARVIEIENRLALLTFDQAPERTFSFLRNRLGASFNHQRSVPGEKSTLPTRLAPERLSSARLRKEALARHKGTVNGFEDRALPALLATGLSADLLHDLLKRLRRPDVPNLPALVVRDLGHRHSGGFGSLPVHGELRLAQLEECTSLRRDLLNDPRFVNAYIARLRPRTDVQWQLDPALREAHLRGLWQFAQRLAPAHNSFKAHVLYHWLRHGLSQGTVDKARFLTYIRLPRNGGPIRREYHRQFSSDSKRYVNLGQNYPTELPRIGNDQTLLRACLEHLFSREDGTATYAEYLDEKWLKMVLAETKLLLGQGDMERWYSLIDDPRRIEQLEKRVEITFPPTQPMVYGADDDVRLEVDTKNVPTLLLKVFAIDSFRYHVERQKEIDATIELDGLVANHEQTFDYAEPPLRRVRRSFDLPMLKAPGAYVVELVGNGISSRAVIHKGGLRAVERTSAAGHLFRVFDEQGTLQKDATVWFGGRDYEADADGDVLIPFSTDPGAKVAVLRVGNRSSVARFQHRSESFSLLGKAFLEREALVAGRTARLCFRPELRVDGHRVASKLLTDRVLRITAVDLDGISRTDEVRDLEFVDDREFVHQLRVPDRLRTLSVALSGKVKDLGGNERALSTETTSFAVNGIDTTAETMASQLVLGPDGYAVELRGKNGEAVPGQPCAIRLKHRDYRQQIDVALQTDEVGRIALGFLPEIDWVQVRVHGGPSEYFKPTEATCILPSVLHGHAGQTLRVPYQGTAANVTRAEFSLLAHDEDAFAHLALENGFLELRDLPAGDYALGLHERGEALLVRITEGERSGAWIVGQSRVLQASTAQPLHLRAIATDDDELRIGLTHFTPNTRVHVIATRYLPAFHPFAHLSLAVGRWPAMWTHGLDASSYHAGRKLGDEYRYVLERRFQTKFAGNMLQRPGLLLHPWALERISRNAAIGLGGKKGGAYRGRGGRDRGADGAPAPEASASQGGAAGTFANLDYLPSGSATLFNLVPDEDGLVTIDIADLGEGQVIHVVAIDGEEALYDRLVREEQTLQPHGRALAAALPADEHFVEQKRIEFVAAGGEAVLGDARSAEVEIFDSLGDVFRLMTTISGNAELQKFAFVTHWPTLDDDAKRRIYSEHACHELHFFLYRRDREFFDAVVEPLLSNKLHRTFMDQWLLGDDLRGWVEPWRFARLNLVEKILLARRLGGSERDTVSRLVAEQLELRPVDRERLVMLFKTALAANELADKETGLRDQLLRAEGKVYRGPGDATPPTGGGRVMRPGGPATGGPAGPSTPGAPKPAGRPASKKMERRKSRAPAEEAEGAAAQTGSDDFFLGAGRRAEPEKKSLGEEVARRDRVGRLFEAVKPTRLLVESNYWRLPNERTTPDLVAPNRFWRDYAAAKAGEPFASEAFVEASGSFLEILFALSVLDLPFEAGEHEVTVDGDRRILRAATPLLLVRKEVSGASMAEDASPLLIGEHFFRLDDRYYYENGEQREKLVTGEFLTRVAYGSQVVISNPTGRRRAIDVLLQIPAGALPVQSGFWTRSTAIQLNPYETKSIEYSFYFPAPGEFAHYPAHAASKGEPIAAAEARTLQVVITPSQLDTRSWEHVSQQGSNAEVLTYLDDNNVQRLELPKIAWRMRDREFFLAITDKLRSRHVYDNTLWSYGLLHRHPATTREHLQHADSFVGACGAAISSTLLTFDPIARGRYHHLELDPLVHARAHRLGSKHVIGNADLARQYTQLLDVLGYHEKLGSEDWLAVTYYLLLQDRVAEALEAAAKITPLELGTRIQYDYLSAYLCFFTGETERARALAEPYREHPVTRWQKRFREVLSHLDEAEGKTGPAGGDEPTDVASKAPALEFTLEGRQAKLAYENLARCEVRYYELDVEFAFSAQPFASSDGTSAAYVQPTLRKERALPADGDSLAFELPERFHNENVLVEVRAGGLVRSRTYFANSLDVRFLEAQGQVAVSDPDTKRPLPKTYVKVFARLSSGQVRFHKDGYTDLRGRFDYASLSDDPNAGAVRYAVLVLSDELGAVIRDVAPPMQ